MSILLGRISEKRFFAICLGLSLILHLCAAHFSGGFLQADEHFQIIEFVNYKLGGIAPVELAAEFQHQARSWVLPWIYYRMTQAMIGLRIDDPFRWAEGFRLFAAIFGWLSLVGLAWSCRRWIVDGVWRRVAVLALAFSWYLPAFQCRTSSESLSSAAFFVGISILVALKNSATAARWGYFAVGLFFGLAFECRFQMGVMIAGVFFWALIRSELNWKSVLSMALAMAVMIGLGRWADTWGYGALAFSPWNYFKYNMLEGRIHVSPFAELLSWEYLRKTFMESWPLLSTVTLVTTIVAWIRHPNHILTWATLPFFVFHQALHHKEIRFLYPIAVVGPIFLVFAFYTAREGARRFEDLMTRKRYRWPIHGVFALNLISLVPATFWPAWTPFRIYDGFYHATDSGEAPGARRVLYYLDRDPYRVSTVPFLFYKPKNLEVLPLQDSKDIALALNAAAPGSSIWLFNISHRLPTDKKELGAYCRPEFVALPSLLVSVLDQPGLHDRFPNVTNWTFFRCRMDVLR